MAKNLLADIKGDRQTLIERHDKRLESHERWCEAAKDQLAEYDKGRQDLIEQHDKRLESHGRWCEVFKDQLDEYDRAIVDLSLNKLLHFLDYVLERTENDLRYLRYSHEEVVETAKHLKKEIDLPCTI